MVLPSGIGYSSPVSVCATGEACYQEYVDSLMAPSPSVTSTQLLDLLQSKYPDTQWSKRALLRRGYELRHSFPGEALTYLEQSAGEFPALTDYLDFWMGEAYERLENWQEAGRAFLKVSRRESDSLLAGEGRYRAGLMLAQGSDCRMALSTLASALALLPESNQAPAALKAMGHCAIEQGQGEEGQKLFRELWWHYPQSSESREVEVWLIRELGEDGFVPTSAERYQRAMALYGAGLLDGAVAEFGRFLSEASPGPQFVQAQYQMAVALARLKRYAEAEGILNRLAQSDSSRTDDAWIWLGRSYLRQGKGEKLGELIRRLPLHGLSGDQRALMFIFYGIWLEDHARWETAREAYTQAAGVAQTLSQKMDALWRVGWISYQQENFVEATKVFKGIATGISNPNSDSLLQSVSQAVYWWARSEQQLEQHDQANQRFLELAQEFPFTYYGQLARHRLPDHLLPSQPVPFLVRELTPSSDIPHSLSSDVHYAKVRGLYELGLFNEAAMEMQEVYRRYGDQPQVFQSLVAMAATVKAYNLGIKLAIRHFGESIWKGELSRTSDAWWGAFPIGYQGLIQELAPSDVDPYLVAGLIREESLYNPRARSGVGAMGLMQLMPATARRMAHQVGMSSWEEDSEALFHPERNIRLGSTYLGQLLDDFHGNLVYAIASYNAGPSAVKRWMGKYGQRSLDEFVELIGYRETRGYVKRVLGSYWIYRAIFSTGCERVSLDTYC